MSESELDLWKRCLDDFGIPFSGGKAGQLDWVFPKEDFELVIGDFTYGMIYPEQLSVESFKGIIPADELSVVAAATSGEILVMRTKGERTFQCHWLGVGFEYHSYDHFDDLLGPPAGTPASIIKELIRERNPYIPICHDRFDRS